tara:strand:+ start:2659 stop:3699 length:1041 start_codon:yes stop_codon:yes gene_type:complete
MEQIDEAVESPQENTDFSEVATDALRDALGTETLDQVESPETLGELTEASEAEPIGEAEGTLSETEVEESSNDLQIEESERLAKRRIRPRNELDQQVIDLYRSSGFEGSFAEASDVIYGRRAPEQAQPPQQARQEQAPAQDPYEPQIQKLKGEIAQFEKGIEEANDELDTSKALKYQREAIRREMQISELNGRRNREIEDHENALNESQRQKALESRNQAVEAYPDLDNRDSVYRKEFDHFIVESEQNPDYAAIFQSPAWPQIMADMFASKKGVQRAAPVPQQNPQSGKLVAPQMGNQARVLTTGQTAQPANTPVSAQGLAQDLPSMSNEDIYSLLGSAGGAKPLR